MRLAGSSVIVAIRLFVSVSVILIVSALPMVYEVDEYVEPMIQIAWSDTEAFVFVGHGTALLKARAGKLWLNRSAQVPSIPELDRRDLLVFEIKGQQITTHDIKGFDSGGGPSVWHGKLFWGRGGEPNSLKSHLWRWTGTEFVEAPLIDEQKMCSEQRDGSDLIQSPGWSLQSLRIRDTPTQTEFRMNDLKLAIRVHATDLPGGMIRNVVSILAPGQTGEFQTVLDIREGYRRISVSEYMRLKTEGHESMRKRGLATD